MRRAAWLERNASASRLGLLILSAFLYIVAAAENDLQPRLVLREFRGEVTIRQNGREHSPVKNEVLAPGSDVQGAPAALIKIVLEIDGRDEEVYQGTNRFLISQPSRYWITAAENDVQVYRANRPAPERVLAGERMLFLYPGDRVITGENSRAGLFFDNVPLTLAEVGEIEVPESADQGFFANFIRGVAKIFKHSTGRAQKARVGNSVAGIVNTDVLVEVKNDGSAILSLLEGRAVVFTNQISGPILEAGTQAVLKEGRILKIEQKPGILTNRSIVAWSLHYPAVLDLSDTRDITNQSPVDPALDSSVTAYRAGNLVHALQLYPVGREPKNNWEIAYRATLFLSVGQIGLAEPLLARADRTQPMADLDAVAMLIAAVKNDSAAIDAETSSQWLARSYYEQSRGLLEDARKSARRAVDLSKEFGFAWSQMAELEFSFGRWREAEAALNSALFFSPEHAPNRVLQGFIEAAKNKIRPALAEFDQALALDPSLASAWLGRGLCLIREGHVQAGRQNLLIAASRDPLNPIYLSYLGKAHSEAGDNTRALKELDLAKSINPDDPTAWLYSALVKDRQNRPNAALRDLQASQEKAGNRNQFRSELLLDQDRAVRSANLARIYAESALYDWGVAEGAKAVERDYSNASAHFFLGQTYSLLRSTTQLDPRFENAAFSEYLLGNLLAPVGAGQLSQYVSQQEYSKLFERNGFGIFSATEYQSSGDWLQAGSQYGTFGDFEYAFDAGFLSRRGDGPNADIEQTVLSLKTKFQLTPSDTMYFQLTRTLSEGGDSRQRYDPQQSTPLRFEDLQEPNVFAGYHHEWHPGSHSLLLVSRLENDFTLTTPLTGVPFVQRDSHGQLECSHSDYFALDQKTEFAIPGFEAQQIWETESMYKPMVIFGGSYQGGEVSSTANLLLLNTNRLTYGQYYFPTNVTGDLSRGTIYSYFALNPLPSLQIIAGGTYDYLTFPENVDHPPLVSGERTRDQLSPKAGFLWEPADGTLVRGAFAQSLGGQYFENSVRLEPAQIAGVVQRYRDVASPALAGTFPGAESRIASAAFHQKIARDTFFSITGEWLESHGDRDVGVFDFIAVQPYEANPSILREDLSYRERAIRLSLNQLWSEEWALGGNYRLSYAELDQGIRDLPVEVAPDAHFDQRGIQHQFQTYVRYQHRSGFFTSLQSLWIRQENQGHYAGDENLWQFDIYAGYRFLQGRGQVTIGLLNLTDSDYRLVPLNAYPELPGRRTLMTSLRLSF